MVFDFSELQPVQRYFLMAQTIVPRPIAWVLTQGPQGYNLAPFSFFNAIGSAPPLVMFSVGLHADGRRKDTALNIVEAQPPSRHVIHLGSADMIEAIEGSAKPLARDESEIEALGLELVATEGFSLPRLVGCAVAMECSFYAKHELGRQWAIYSQVEALWVDDAAVGLDDKGRPSIDAVELKALGRLGPKTYCPVGAAVKKVD